MKKTKKYLIVAAIILIILISPLLYLEIARSTEFSKLSTKKEPAGATYGQPSHTPTYEIMLKSGHFTPEPLTGEEIEEVIDKNNIYYLVQFYDRSIWVYFWFNFYGIGRLGYLPDDTFIIKIPENTKPVMLYPSIRWIGIWEPERKINPTLKEEIDSLTPDETVNITIEFFSLNEEQLDQVKNMSVGFKPNGRVFIINPDNLLKIAELNFVKWITGEPHGHLI